MHLCRYPNCRSYGKLDGFCLIHAKSNTMQNQQTQPTRLAFTPPPYSIPPQTSMPMTTEDNSLLLISRILPLPTGELRCFAPRCTVSALGQTPFCTEHQHCVLLVDTEPKLATQNTSRKRRRLSSIEGNMNSSTLRTYDEGKCIQAPSGGRRHPNGSNISPSQKIASPEHEHARILANLGRSC